MTKINGLDGSCCSNVAVSEAKKKGREALFFNMMLRFAQMMYAFGV